jgi:hypothetical protein
MEGAVILAVVVVVAVLLTLGMFWLCERYVQ